jgi:hypothetical protein
VTSTDILPVFFWVASRNILSDWPGLLLLLGISPEDVLHKWCSFLNFASKLALHVQESIVNELITRLINTDLSSCRLKTTTEKVRLDSNR